MAKRIYNQTALFGELYAYLVVISPPDSVLAEIAKIKRVMNAIADIGDRNLYSVGHITLTDKLTDDDSFPETIANLLKGQTKFSVKLSGVGQSNHKDKNIILLHVADPEPIINLSRLLKSPSKSPHVALAKRISPETLAALQPYLINLSFEAEWICEEILVLRKRMSQKEKGFREQFKIPLI
ncbi:MAG: 2'-5' RNA ligase family protein [Flavobacterium sp.]|uniref:2'-5' RNA ligase family protein n=1 Tax=Flavobacterium sp. TaxID=239 RepID=UPI00120D98A6|nr:2'-5' RNA ligase family protein [Flavobacterium sp.]RZJ67472.1 MAG: 2'-5' RNA ligase family protein [Flavobacterium sp.]